MSDGQIITVVVDHADERDVVTVDGVEMGTAEAADYVALQVYLGQLRTAESCDEALEELRHAWRIHRGDRDLIERNARAVRYRREELVGEVR
jgi:hypothetical protein